MLRSRTKCGVSKHEGRLILRDGGPHGEAPALALRDTPPALASLGQGRSSGRGRTSNHAAFSGWGTSRGGWRVHGTDESAGM